MVAEPPGAARALRLLRLARVCRDRPRQHARADQAGRADVRRLRGVRAGARLADVSLSALAAVMDTVKIIEGDGRAGGRRFALVVAQYHDFVTDRLQAGALAALAAAGVAPDGIMVVRVPG